MAQEAPPSPSIIPPTILSYFVLLNLLYHLQGCASTSSVGNEYWAQWLNSLAALPEDPRSIPSTNMVANKLSVTPILRAPTPSSGIHRRQA